MKPAAEIMTGASICSLIEESTEIAWNYLERTGQIEDRSVAYRQLSLIIAGLIKDGVTNRLRLSNYAIAAFERARKARCPVG